MIVILFWLLHVQLCLAKLLVSCLLLLCRFFLGLLLLFLCCIKLFVRFEFLVLERLLAEPKPGVLGLLLLI